MFNPSFFCVHFSLDKMAQIASLIIDMGGSIMRTVFVIIYILSLFIVSSAIGSIDFTLEREIDVPDSLGISEYSLADLDGDGNDEVIVDRDEFTAVFSIAKNQVTDFFEKKIDTYIRRYAYGYIDDDSLLDYFEVVLTDSLDWDGFFFGVANGLTYLSSNDFVPSDTTLLYEVPPLDYDHEYDIIYISELFLKDLDHNGQCEVYLKLQMRYNHCYSGLLCNEYIYNSSFRYIFGEESTVAMLYLPPNSEAVYPLYDDSNSYSVRITDLTSYHTIEKPYYQTFTRAWSHIGIFDGDSIIAGKVIRPIYECPIFYDGYEYQYSLIKEYCIRDVSSFSSGYELIAEVYQSASGYNGPGPFPTDPTCFYSSYQLVCNDLSSPDSISEIWNIEFDTDPEIQFIFSDSLYMDRFLTYQNNRIFERRSYDGSIADSSDILILNESPMAYKSIMAGGPRYLVTKSGNTLRFYSVDVVVPVEEDSRQLFPAAFSMGEPYPNPYNANVTIPLSIAAKGDLSVAAYNILGQRVDVIYEGEARLGELQLTWNSGKFSSGIYFIRAALEESTATTKVILLK